MSGQNLYAALLGLRATPRPAHHYPCPRRGAGGGARTRNPPRTDAPPTANPHPARKEANPMDTPPVEELLRQFEEDGGCEATDGCWVEPGGHREHGQPSWLLALGLI